MGQPAKARQQEAWQPASEIMTGERVADNAALACGLDIILEQLHNGSAGHMSSPGAPLKKMPTSALSVRATNVLKELAAELTGDEPPKGPWSPPAELARKLTRRHLMTTRNCGPQTLNEIVRWAEAQGVSMQPLFHSGKSLSTMWQDVIAGFASGKFGKVEILQALEKSMRRRNTRIPVAFQAILLQILTSI